MVLPQDAVEPVRWVQCVQEAVTFLILLLYSPAFKYRQGLGTPVELQEAVKEGGLADRVQRPCLTHSSTVAIREFNEVTY